MQSHFQIVALVLLALLVSACTTQPTQNTRAQAVNRIVVSDIKPAGPEDLNFEYRYRLSYGDQLDVRFLRQVDYSTTVVVGHDGTVNLPFLRSVRVEGMTLDQAAVELESRYAQLIANAPDPVNKVYKIGVGDVLEIKFPYVEQYSAAVVVRPDGRISLPLIGAVVAEDKEPGILQDQLVELYEEHLANPVLVLNVAQAASHAVYANGQPHRVRVALPDMDNIYLTLRNGLEPKVYVGGEVGNPRAIQYEPMLSSLQAILAAGGTTTRSELSNVVILRKGINGDPRYIVRDLAADIDGDEVDGESGVVTTNDILLRPFDVVIVPKTAIAGVADVLDAYVYDLLPMLRNSSIGFNYQIGTMEVEQDTKVKTIEDAIID